MKKWKDKSNLEREKNMIKKYVIYRCTECYFSVDRPLKKCPICKEKLVKKEIIIDVQNRKTQMERA